MNAERTRLNLELIDDEPLTDADLQLYNETMARVTNQ